VCDNGHFQEQYSDESHVCVKMSICLRDSVQVYCTLTSSSIKLKLRFGLKLDLQPQRD
jgi:hypothetical protein